MGNEISISMGLQKKKIIHTLHRPIIESTKERYLFKTSQFIVFLTQSASSQLTVRSRVKLIAHCRKLKVQVALRLFRVRPWEQCLNHMANNFAYSCSSEQLCSEVFLCGIQKTSMIIRWIIDIPANFIKHKFWIFVTI